MPKTLAKTKIVHKNAYMLNSVPKGSETGQDSAGSPERVSIHQLFNF